MTANSKYFKNITINFACKWQNPSILGQRPIHSMIGNWCSKVDNICNHIHFLSLSCPLNLKMIVESFIWQTYIYDIGSRIKKELEIVNCTFSVDMTHLLYIIGLHSRHGKAEEIAYIITQPEGKVWTLSTAKRDRWGTVILVGGGGGESQNMSDRYLPGEPGQFHLWPGRG